VLLNYNIGRLVLSSLCVGDLMRVVLSGARFAGRSTMMHGPININLVSLIFAFLLITVDCIIEAEFKLNFIYLFTI
jgi:hypothetical protein